MYSTVGRWAALCLFFVPGAASSNDISGVLITSLSSGSLHTSWTIPATSTPTIVLSTNNFSTAFSSGTGALAQSTTGFGTLTPNTTYWFEVKNSTEADSNYVFFNADKATSTLAAVPGAAAFSGVTISTIQANWSSSSNGPGTIYQAILSSGSSPSTNGFFGNASSATLNAFALFFTGLSVNTTYFMDVRAVNNNGVATAYTSLGSTATLANLPASSAPTGVAATSITANWGTSFNPPGTRYLVQIATETGFSTISGSSNTANTSAVLAGLTPNTTYFMQVLSQNFSGAVSTFTALPSTSTLAAAPSSAAFSGVTISTIQANWASSSNGPGTVYEAILSSGSSPSTNGFFGNASSATLNAFALFSTGLSVNTTYFVDVRAVNNNGVTTEYASLGSTATLANVPASSAPTGVEVASITANWGISSNPPGTRYIAWISADSGFNPMVGSSNTANTFTVFSGLNPNTTYFMQVQSLNFSGAVSTFSALPSTSTLAAVPASAAFSGVTISTIQANWSSSSNGPGTIYEAILSSGSSPSTNGFFGNASSTTRNAFAIFATGLSLNATYFFEVRAVNNNNIVTAYASLGATSTLANVPASSAPASIEATQLTALWGTSGNPPGTRYEAQASPISDFATVISSSNTAITSATLTGLTPNTTYFLRVRSLNFSGGPSDFLTLPSTSTLAAAPSSAAFSGVSVSSLQANWTTSSNGPGTVYTAVLSSGSSPSSNGFSGNQSLNTTGVFALFTGLTLTTTYYVEVRALNNNNLFTAYTSLGSTLTVSSIDSISADQSQAIVLNTVGGEIRLDIPAQAFGESVAVSASVPASFPTAASDLQGVGFGVEVTVVPALQPLGEVNLSIGYPQSVGNVFDEGKLIIARYDPLRNVWVPLISRPDPAANKVTARINHFSLFQVMQASVSGDLSKVKAFPNPFRPHQGQNSMTFTRLPAGARLRIYSYLGQLIRELSSDNAGMASWDGKGDPGKPASSGVYVVLIEGSGAKRTFKVAIER